MRLLRTILIALLFCLTSQPMGAQLPANIQQYLQSGSLTEEGELSGTAAEQTTFIDYVKANWSSMLDVIDTIAPKPHEQMLVVAGAEYLAGRQYLQFVNKLCDRKAAGKVTQRAFELGITALTPKKLGFLAYNYQDTQVRQLVQRLQGMLPPNTELQSFLAKILAGAAVEGAETATKGQGLPEPETLAPQ